MVDGEVEVTGGEKTVYQLFEADGSDFVLKVAASDGVLTGLNFQFLQLFPEILTQPHFLE